MVAMKATAEPSADGTLANILNSWSKQLIQWDKEEKESENKTQ